MYHKTDILQTDIVCIFNTCNMVDESKNSYFNRSSYTYDFVKSLGKNEIFWP